MNGKINYDSRDKMTQLLWEIGCNPFDVLNKKK